MIWTREVSNPVMRWWGLPLKSLIFKSPEHQIAECLRFAEFILSLAQGLVLRETEGLVLRETEGLVLRETEGLVLRETEGLVLRETEGLIKSSKNEFLMKVLLCLIMLSLERLESLSCPQDLNSDFYLQKKHYWTERQKRTGG